MSKHSRRKREKRKKIGIWVICLFLLFFLVFALRKLDPDRNLSPHSSRDTESHAAGKEESLSGEQEEQTSDDSDDKPVRPARIPADVPEEILEFVGKYPEAAPFAENYSKRRGPRTRIDLKGEVKKGSIPLFIQWDERWGYEQYGENYLGINGCGPTCLSMVVCGLTGSTKWNPKAVADFSAEQGYYDAEYGTSWGLMSEGAQQLGLNAQQISADETAIRENLSERGKAIICSMLPGDFTYTGHFIVLTGLDENGDVIVNDPNSPKNSGRHWSMNVLLPQIRSMWVYTERQKTFVDYAIRIR